MGRVHAFACVRWDGLHSRPRYWAGAGSKVGIMDETLFLRFVSAMGLFAIVGLAWVFSEDRSKASGRLVAWGLGLQFGFGVLILRTRFGRALFDGVRGAFDVVTRASTEGASFLFGNLTKVFVLRSDAVAGAEQNLMINATLAFQVLPLIIFASALAGILFHLRVIQAVVRFAAWLMRRTLKTSGAETFSTALLVFLGIESMTAVRAYLQRMTRSELCTVMTAFMSTIAASVMLAYANFGAEPGHLLAASVMSAPAAILISKLLTPETGEPLTVDTGRIEVPVESRNVIDAASRGASEGLKMALNVGAMLIAFVGLVYLCDQALEVVIERNLTQVMGWLFRPFAVLMGVPLRDVGAVSELLGTKTVLNEFLAYSNLEPMVREGSLSPRSITIATYALCGFANPGSLAILIGGLSGLIPERRAELAALGLKAFAGGTLACFSTACVAGVVA